MSHNEEVFVPLQEARAMVRPRRQLGRATRSGKVARQTIITMALRGELEAHEIAGRLVVTQSSIDRFNAAQS